MSDRTAMWVKCGDCKYVWAAVYLPMEMGKAARLMQHLYCASCGSTAERVFLAEAADIPPAPAPSL